LDLSAVIIYPNTKEVAFASLGFLKVYEILRVRLRVADVSYLPEGPEGGGGVWGGVLSPEKGLLPGQGDAILSPKKGLLLGRMSRVEVRRFDIVGFSVSYENDFAHIPELLITAGMPPLAEARCEPFPLVICGGFTMTMNPLPIADFVDAIVVGEVEPVVDSLLAAIDDAKARGLSKPHLLESLSQIEGVYIPSLGDHEVKRVWSRVESIASEPASQVASHFGSMFLVEVGRGCGRGCLFCAAGNLYRPVRMRSEAAILERALEFKKIGLVGTAVGDHPALIPVLKRLAEEGRRVGLASLRADEITPEIADLIVKCGIRTITIAPEAGSETLRARIGKRISRDQVTGAVKILGQAGIRTIKLYFMIGLPGETDEDVRATVALVRELAELRGKARLSIAVGPFVPKPHTAFQWCGFAERETLSRRAKILKTISAIKGCSLKLGSFEEAWLEAVLSRGDRRLSRALLEAAEKKIPVRAMLKHRTPVDIHADLDVEKPLPWDFIDSGVTRNGLRDKLRKSKGA
jgi:radical SAM superfamily enzyme YgiQ (UPF0313 family)